MTRTNEEEKNLPIDRGWAWVIAAATSILFGVCAGGFKSQGVILVELQERFPEASASELLWIFSLAALITKGTGPLVTFIITKASHRMVAFLGTIVMAAAVIISGYLPIITPIYFTYGVCYGISGISGIGNGLLALTVILATRPYFKRRKAMAVGITGAGSGIGTILIPILLRTLFDNLGFSGALLLYGGFILQWLVVASLLRPLSFYERSKSKRLRQTQEDENPAVNDCPPKLIVTDYDGKHSGSSDFELLCDKSHGSYRNRSMTFHIGQKTVFNNTVFRSIPDMRGKPQVADHKKSRLLSIGDLSMTSHYEIDFVNDGTTPEVASDENTDAKYNWCIFMNPLSILMGISLLFRACGMGVVYQCIPSLGKSSGVPKDQIALLFIIAGVIEIVCRPFNGWLADRNVLSAFSLFTLCIAITGVCALICATVSGAPGIIVMMAGLSSAGTSVYSLMPVVCEELFGRDNLAAALGICRIYEAIGFALATPLAGQIYEAFGRWEAVFYHIGIALLLAATIITPYNIIKFFRQRTKSVQNTQADN